MPEVERDGLTPAKGTKQSFLLHCSLAIRADGTRRVEGVLAASYHVPTDAVAGILQERWNNHFTLVRPTNEQTTPTVMPNFCRGEFLDRDRVAQ
ncbi:MAG TPA: hypothetical protein VIV60_08650 [Polyangiaceae bacterium]